MNINPWVWRIMIVILVLAFAPIVISGVANLVGIAVHSVGREVYEVTRFAGMRGTDRVQGAVTLCLYVGVLVVIIKVLSGNRGE
jgi:hypothetical protein